jgi:hypothetical protein
LDLVLLGAAMRQLRPIDGRCKAFPNARALAAAFPPSPGQLVLPSRRPLVAPLARPASTSGPRPSAGSPALRVSVTARSTRLLVSFRRLWRPGRGYRASRENCVVSLWANRVTHKQVPSSMVSGSLWQLPLVEIAHSADAMHSQVRHREAPSHSQRP